MSRIFLRIHFSKLHVYEIFPCVSKKVITWLFLLGSIDRNYFFSLYFREPGGVLFELATENPGFSIDEPVSELGASLKLPAQYEKNRQQIEQALPQI